MPTATTSAAYIDNGGTVQVSGPAASQFVWLGSTANKAGSLEVLAGGVANFTTVVVGGSGGVGSLRVAEGGRLTTYGGPLGSDIQSVGTAVVDGPNSLWRLTAELVVGGNGKGMLTVSNGGTVTVDNGQSYIGLADNFVAEGTLQIGTGGAAGFVNAIDVHAHDGKGTVIFNHNEASYTFGPAMVENVAVRHVGPGRTVLSKTNTYTGSTVVTGGELIVQGRLEGIGTVSILETGLLGGSGFIAGSTTIESLLSPGLDTGLMTFGSDLTLGTNATVRMELGGYLRGTQFDAVNLSGAMKYAGGLQIVLANGFEPKVGEAFRLFAGYTSQSGTFGEIDFSIAGYEGVFNPVSGTLTISAIPEPHTIGMIAGALGLLLGISRSRGTITAPA